MPFKNILDPRDLGVESSGIEKEMQYVQLMKDPYGRQILELESMAQAAIDPFLSWVAWVCGYTRDTEAEFFYKLLKGSLIIYFLLSVAISFARPYFLDLTIITLSIFQINDPRYLKRNHFRLLILLVIVSVFYDIYWTVYLSSEYSKDQQDPGEMGIDVYHKQNSVMWTCFNIFWKGCVYLPVLLRVSMDFRAVLKDHS